MELDPQVKDQIDQLIASDRVVLFMKGQRGAPQCGFSATVCQILDGYLPQYSTVNVLADTALREGIKTYSQWPTIPQLYVAGEFVGGCDIVQEMAADGSLAEALGVQIPAGEAPELTITDSAAKALQQITAEQEGDRALHLRIDASFQTGLYFGPKEEGYLSASSNGVTLRIDPLSATRANGLVIDVEDTSDGPGFRIVNPNAPSVPQVQNMTASELKTLMDSGQPFELFDVRTPEERAIAAIEGAHLLDQTGQALLEKLDRDTTVVFHCHHGGRSQQAAEHYAAQGFTNVWNLTGGIDAWSREVDPNVPRY